MVSSEVPLTFFFQLAPRNGANEGYLFDGAGAAFVLNDITRKGAPCSYGGVVYAYNDTTLRIWRPDHSDGAAVCIGDEMGQGINSQASNSVNLVVTVWGLPYERKYSVSPVMQTFTFGSCADSEGPDQTARMRSLIRGLRCPQTDSLGTKECFN